MHPDEDMTQEEFDRAFAGGTDVHIVGSARIVVEEARWLPGATRIVTEWGGAIATIEPVGVTASEIAGTRHSDQARNFTPA
jgi:hypothetical protein